MVGHNRRRMQFYPELEFGAALQTDLTRRWFDSDAVFRQFASTGLAEPVRHHHLVLRWAGKPATLGKRKSRHFPLRCGLTIVPNHYFSSATRTILSLPHNAVALMHANHIAASDGPSPTTPTKPGGGIGMSR